MRRPTSETSAAPGALPSAVGPALLAAQFASHADLDRPIVLPSHQRVPAFGPIGRRMGMVRRRRGQAFKALAPTDHSAHIRGTATRPCAPRGSRARSRANPQPVPGRGEPGLRAGPPAGHPRRHQRCAAAVGQDHSGGTYRFRGGQRRCTMSDRPRARVCAGRPNSPDGRIRSCRGLAPAPHTDKRFHRNGFVPLLRRPNTRPAPTSFGVLAKVAPGGALL